MAIGLVKDSSVARDGADQGLGGIVDGRSCGECAARPSKGTPNGDTHVLAVCAAPSELDYFVALALQQHGQQSALRKGRDHNFPFSLSKRWTIFAGIPFIPSGRFASRDPTNRRIASQSLYKSANGHFGFVGMGGAGSRRPSCRIMPISSRADNLRS